MKETPEDLDQLQSLLTRSIVRAGAFLRESFQMPEHSLSAKQITARLQGIQNVAFATVTSTGEPRVAPIGSIFYRGRFHIPTVATAARARQVKRNPAVSLALFEGNDFAIIAHGRAVTLPQGEAGFAALEAVHREINGGSPAEWGEGVYLRLDPDVMYTFARYQERFLE